MSFPVTQAMMYHICFNILYKPSIVNKEQLVYWPVSSHGQSIKEPYQHCLMRSMRCHPSFVINRIPLLRKWIVDTVSPIFSIVLKIFDKCFMYYFNFIYFNLFFFIIIIFFFFLGGGCISFSILFKTYTYIIHDLCYLQYKLGNKSLTNFLQPLIPNT